MTLAQVIATFEDFVVNAEGGETITFTVVEDDDFDLPVVDYSVKNSVGLELYGCMSYDSFEAALIGLAAEMEEA